MYVSIFYILILVLLIFPSPKKAFKPERQAPSIDNSNKIKGILCVCVMFHHFASWFTAQNLLMYIFIHIGSFVVAPFFFLSGYGVYKSDNKKAITVRLFIRRFLRILIPFWICDIIYIAAHFIFKIGLSVPVTAANILLSLVSIKEMVASSWYVCALLCIYILYYACMKFLPRKYLCTVMVIVMLAFFFIVPELWLTYITFPAGVFIAKNEEKILSVLNNRIKHISILLSSVIILALSIILKMYGNNNGNENLMHICDTIGALALVIAIYVIITKVELGGKLAAFYGKISYEFYLIHGLSLFIANKYFGLEHSLLFFLSAFAFSTTAAFIINIISQKATTFVFKKLNSGDKT